MKIVHLVGTLELGGIERLVTDWCLRLHERHDVAVICLLGKRGPFVKDLEKSGVRVIDFQQPGSGLGMIRYLARILRKLHPDVVHTHCAWSMLQQVLAVRFSGSGALVLTVHNQYRFGTQFAAFRRKVLARIWAKQVKAVVVISEAVNRWTQSWLGLRPGIITTIYNGIDTAKFSPAGSDTGFACGVGIAEDVPILAAIGSLSEQKDISTVIRASAIIKRAGLKFCLLIVGEGPQRKALESFAKDEGVGEEVFFLGSRTDVPEILRGSQVFVHGARWEGFGLVVAEAQACALPVVSTAVGGVPEIVEDGVTGLLVPAGDAKALAAAVTKLLLEPALAREMGARGRKRVERFFSVERCVQEYEELYKNAVEAS